MPLTSWPFENQVISEDQYGQLIGLLTRSGVVGVPGDNSLKPSANGSGMNVQVTAGAVFIRGHMAADTASATVTVPAAGASARTDTLVARLTLATDNITLVVKQGTTALTWGSGVFEIPIARIAVGANVTSITNANVTDLRQFAGKTIGMWTDATRVAEKGALGFNFTDNTLEACFDGTNWIKVSLAGHTHTASQITNQSGIDAGKVNGIKITSNNNGVAPSSPSVGDLWADAS